jgi:peptidoglycan/LPS O-acetylase OafA/YrhL
LMGSQEKCLDPLQGLRGLAALHVMIAHFLQLFTP